MPATASSPPAPHPVKSGAFLVGTATVEVTVPAPPGQVAPSRLPTHWVPRDRKRGEAGTRPNWVHGSAYCVFAGFDLAVSVYSSLLDHWASAGFMVAAPTYPYTAPPAPPDEADILNHPGHFVR